MGHKIVTFAKGGGMDRGVHTLTYRKLFSKNTHQNAAFIKENQLITARSKRHVSSEIPPIVTQKSWHLHLYALLWEKGIIEPRNFNSSAFILTQKSRGGKNQKFKKLFLLVNSNTMVFK